MKRNKKHQTHGKEYRNAPMWRTIFVGSVFVILFNVLWIVSTITSKDVLGRGYVFLLFAGMSLLSFLLLILFLVKNTAKMSSFSHQLLDAKNELESIVENIDVGIIEYDADFVVTLVNSTAEKILGIKEDEVMHKTIHPNMVTNATHLQSFIHVLYPVLSENAKKVPTNKSQHLNRVELKITSPIEMDLQVTTIPILDRWGNASTYIKTIRDISREKAIAKAKSEFISVAAHQLRTPLSAIKWVLKMVIDGDTGEITKEQKDFLQKGYESNERIISLVTDMLDVARIEEGRFGFEFYLVDFIEIIQRVVDTFQIRARERKVQLHFEKPITLAPIKLDPARITLALQNLIDNAIKYTTIGGMVTVRASIDGDGKYIKVSVQDTGIGIPHDQRHRLFIKFYRGSNARRLETEGTGLGLFIAKNIIAKHGGSIWIEPDKDGVKGSTFSFLLPIKNEDHIKHGDII